MRTMWFGFVTVFATGFFALLALVGGLVRARRGWFDWIHRSWGRIQLAAAGARLDVDGLEHLSPDRAQIIMSNHQSNADIWALMAGLPVSLRFVTKKELARIPLFGRACRAAGHVFIDRSDPAAASEAIRRTGRRLEEDGLTLVLFPEGTRSTDGRLGRFKRGSFALAIELGINVIPVAITGSRAVLPPGGRPAPGPIAVRCMPPIPVEGLDAESRYELTERTRASIAVHLEPRGASSPGVDPA